jgi:deazaflavin-dependent oxidoreductase (nitroreductase family)
MGPTIEQALSRSQLVDITTMGRRSHEPRRIEIYLHSFDGGLFISGRPAPQKRAWLANLESDPRMTLHLKGSAGRDVPATARIVTDESERRRVLEQVARAWRRTDLDVMVEQSPLIEVVVNGAGAGNHAA